MEKGLSFFFLFAFFFAFSSFSEISAEAGDAGTGEDDHMDKETISFEVSTVDYKDWYDDRCTNGLDDDGDGKKDGHDSDCDGGGKGLKPNLFCDASADPNSGNVEPYPTDLAYSPCDKDGVHDDYYSTSAANENDVWTSDKDFTIKVKASDSSGIDSIRIEWISGVNKNRNAAGYWDSAMLESYKKLDTALNPHLTSYTCYPSADAVAECEICVVGGDCDNPVIPTGDLGISGSQQIIFMRTIVTDGEMNSISTGFDETGVGPVRDKFYRFVVCSTSCNADPDGCMNNSPVTSLLRVKRQLTCEGPLYTLVWQFEDADQKSRPSSYILEVRDKSKPDTVYSAVRMAKDGLSCEDTCGCDGYYTKCEMSAKLFDGFLHTSDGTAKNIEYDNITYEWRVKVYDNSTEKYCLGVSEWSKWSSEYGSSMNFTTPHPAPVVSFSMANGSGADCSKGGCVFGDDITFTDTSKTDPATSIASYNWNIDGKKYGSSSSSWVAETFAEGSAHTISLAITDRQGISCSAQAELKLGDVDDYIEPEEEGNAGWDEIAPR
jgi:hypothetical protein